MPRCPPSWPRPPGGGHGRADCWTQGAALAGGTRKPEDDWDRRLLEDKTLFQTAVLRRFELYKPVIAAVDGVALAGGCEIILATDLRIATAEASFGLSEAKRGIVPGAGSLARLARQIPYREAMRIMLLGDAIPASEALRIGLVNEVVPRERLMPRALELAGKLAANGPLALRKIKEAVLRSGGRPLEDAFDIEDECARVVMRSEDARDPGSWRSAPRVCQALRREENIVGSSSPRPGHDPQRDPRYLVRELGAAVPQLEDGRSCRSSRCARWRRRSPSARRRARALMKEAPRGDAAFSSRILSVEMSRVRGVALAHARASVCGGDIARRARPSRRRGRTDRAARKIGCWALTEPQAGSAAIRDMKSTAVRDGDHYVLNGTKMFITNAPYADVFVVYAKLAENGAESARAFVLERGDPGLATGKPFKKMGFRSSPTGEVFLSDCRVPADRLLGGPSAGKRSGGSGSTVKERLSRERVGLVAISYGSRSALDIALDYAHASRAAR
jgi:enoyl-CoA hydratase/carnithine racemase